MDSGHFQRIRWPGFISVLLLAIGAARAQCVIEATLPLPSFGVPGALGGGSGTMKAMMWWDPDGAGPAAPVLVCGGTFHAIGNLATANVAAFDPATSTWAALGSGLDGAVLALATLPTGDLVAGGGFSDQVATWDGVAWTSLPGFRAGAAVAGVSSLAIHQGDLIAGGDFRNVIASNPAGRVARWNAGWTQLGSPPLTVGTMAVLPSGELVASGHYNGPARWTGTNWVPMASGFFGTQTSLVYSLLVRSNGDLLVGGAIYPNGTGPRDGVVRWDGTTWFATGLTDSRVVGLTQLPNGDVLAAGRLQESSASPRPAAMIWNGSTWAMYGTPVEQDFQEHSDSVAVLPNGNAIVGGRLATARFCIVGAWNGSAWEPPQPVSTCGFTVREALAGPADNAFVAGPAWWHGALAYKTQVWELTDSALTAIGAPANGLINALALHPNGALVAGGGFTTIGNVAAKAMAAWDGVAWSALGQDAATSRYISSLAIDANGDILAISLANYGGPTRIGVERWDGTSWTYLGMSGSTVIAPVANGEFYVGGYMAELSLGVRGVAHWDGSNWQPLGSADMREVKALLVLPNGDLLAGGTFGVGAPADYLARWNASTWQALGSPPDAPIEYLRLLPNGDVLVGGEGLGSIGGVPVDTFARWDGTSFHPFGDNTAIQANVATGQVFTVDVLGDGDVLVGGLFNVYGGAASSNLVRLRSSCAATTTSIGTGCGGAAGTDVLEVLNGAWLGGAARFRVTGIPSPALVIGVFGLQPFAPVPISIYVSLGIAGCDLLVSPDLSITTLPNGSEARFQLGIPMNAALLNATFDTQAITFELTASAVSGITSSNAARLGIGSF